MSADTMPEVFELPADAASTKLAFDINTNWPQVMGWTRGLAHQLPIETLGNTPFYYEAANIHHQPSSASSWLAEQKKTVFEWLNGLLEHTELTEEQTGSTRMRLLDLHCPALPGCSTTFGRSRETGNKNGFQMEIMGFGGGSKHTATFSDTLVMSAKEQCVEVWVPLRYTAKQYRLGKASKGKEELIHTVKPTGIGDDIEIIPAQCKGQKCSVISSFDQPKSTYTLTSAATMNKEIRYEAGSSMKTLIGIALPWNFKIGIEANISFNYAVEYSFNLAGPGNYSAYEISYLSSIPDANKNIAQESRTLIETPGFAWEWKKNGK